MRSVIYISGLVETASHVTSFLCRVLLWFGRQSVGRTQKIPQILLVPDRSRSGVSGTHAGQNIKHGGVSQSVVSRQSSHGQELKVQDKIEVAA